MDPIDYTQIKGWAVDANEDNDPTYPIKKRTNADHLGYNWVRPTQQPENVEVLQSIERPHITSVFGTSTPPSGLSGMIRRFAFKFSESSYGHWVPLILADRINMVEGILGDLRKGHVPNIPAELGWKAEWKHNRKGLVTRVLVGTLLLGAIVAHFASEDDDN